MKTYKNLYHKIYKWENLILAYKKARKGKTRKDYVREFEEYLKENLQALQFELMTFTYFHRPLESFPLRDPKTRKISKSNFRDRVIHHALINIVGPIFEKSFIYDSCANQKGKGNLFAINRFEKFKREISNNGLVIRNKFSDKNYVLGYCLKADIKHYFREIDLEILLKMVSKKIKDENVVWLVEKILRPRERERDGTRCY